jgi:hypothetical protein
MDTTKTYETPAIVFEGELEVQAGSPIGVLDDPFFEDSF